MTSITNDTKPFLQGVLEKIRTMWCVDHKDPALPSKRPIRYIPYAVMGARTKSRGGYK